MGIFKYKSTRAQLTHFMPLVSFYMPLKTSENLRSSDVFRGVEKKTSDVKWVKQQSRRRVSLNKTKSRQDENRQRNNTIKNKQISFEFTHASDCFTTVICIMYLY